MSLTLLVLAAGLAANAQPQNDPRLLSDTRRLAKGLIALDTSNPPGNELLAATYLKRELDKEGLASEIFTYPATRSSLVARVKGSGKKRPLLLMCHTDVVPADRKEWSVDPFVPIEKDGFLYGRGALDIKTMCAAEAAVLLRLKRSAAPLDRDVVFFAEADEEAGEAHHLAWLLKNHPEALNAEFGINEGGESVWKDGALREVRIQTAEKQYMDVQLVARGTSGHASIPLPDNALARLARAVSKVAAFRPKARLEPTVRGFFESQLAFEKADVRQAMQDVLDAAPVGTLALAPEGLKDALNDPRVQTRLDKATDRLQVLKPEYGAMLRDTINPTILKAGYKSNVVPAEAEATFNSRLMPGRDPKEFIRELAAVIGDPGIDIRFTPPSPSGVPAMPLDTDLYRAAESALARLSPAPRVTPFMAAWSTDSQSLRARGVVLYGMDPPQAEGDDDREHGTDERIPLAALDAYAGYLLETVLNVAGSR